VSQPWLRALAAPAALERLTWIAASSAVAALTQRCLQLLAALLAAGVVADDGGGGGEDDGGSPPIGAVRGADASAGQGDRGRERPTQAGAESAQPSLESMLEAGLLEAVGQLLTSAADALAPTRPRRGSPQAQSSGDGGGRGGRGTAAGGWDDSAGEEEGERAGQGGDEAAAAGAFEPSVVEAVLDLVLQISGQPGGVEAIDAYDAGAYDGTSGLGEGHGAAPGAGGGQGRVCGALLRLLAACAAEGGAAGADPVPPSVRDRALMAAAQLPRARRGFGARPALAAAAAEALLESDLEDLDLQDACWYLIACSAAAALERRTKKQIAARPEGQTEGPPPSPAAAGEANGEGDGEEGAALRRVWELLPRCRVPESSRRYADEATRCLEAFLDGGGGGGGGRGS
jgi:hypothetical protein